MGAWEERVWHGKPTTPTINDFRRPWTRCCTRSKGWRGTRERLRFSTASLRRQPSRLFAVEYGVNIMRALRTFVVAALMATTAWTPTHAAERVDLLHRGMATTIPAASLLQRGMWRSPGA